MTESHRTRDELADSFGAPSCVDLVPIRSFVDDRVHVEDVPSHEDKHRPYYSLPGFDWLGEREDEKRLPRRQPLQIVDVAVIGVYDGDTFRVSLLAMPDDLAFIREWCVRIRGVDCPELHDIRSEFRALAEDARTLLQRLLSSPPVTLHHVGKDKYFRLLADVTANGIEVGQQLLAARLARPWTGKGPKPW